MESNTTTTHTLRVNVTLALARWRAAGMAEDGPEAEAYCAAALALTDRRRVEADQRWARTVANMVQKGIVLE
jgi:hypothetical protein